MKLLKQLALGSTMLCSLYAFSGNPPAAKKDQSPERLKRGEKLVMSLCALCHGGNDGKLSGKNMSDLPNFLGKVYTANITNDMENGIGKYSREQLRTLLRTRIKANGQKALALMPAFPLMADEDVEAIIDFLKSDHPSLQASSVKQPASTPSWMFRSYDKKVVPLSMPEKLIAMPDPNNAMALGNYYVNAVFRCYECHSPEMVPNDLNPTSSKKYNAGGKTMADEEKNKVKVANITPDKETGIGNYSVEEFRKLMRTGIRHNGKPLSYPMFPLPALTDQELDAIFTYLMAQKPIHHKVKSKS